MLEETFLPLYSVLFKPQSCEVLTETMSYTSRLQRECRELIRNPIPYISAAPLPHDILDWRYVISGPVDTPFEGGYFYGKLSFPADYPFRPPSIYMTTPNGRFKVGLHKCYSVSAAKN